MHNAFRRRLPSRRLSERLGAFYETLLRAGLTAAICVFVGLGGADGALRAIARSDLLATVAENAVPASAEAAMGMTDAHAPASSFIWTIDTDNDGDADFSNPTHGGVRGVDAFGSGVFGAVRDAGKRRHHGVDYIASPGAIVRAPIAGKVTHIGFAYGGTDALRSVEIANADTGLTARVLYVSPTIAEGDVVAAGDDIGVAQDLGARYPGITNHVHVELRDARRVLMDASQQLPSAPVSQASASTIDAAS